MATNLLYLDDSYLFASHGVVQVLGRDARGAFVILDQSIFYPQGGGQPCDKGYLVAGGIQVPVTFVGFQNGDVMHYVPDAYWQAIAPGQSFDLRVDAAHRLKDARLHTGGHLLSHVLETIQPSLTPIKGYHFHDGSYVEFINSDSIDVTRLLDQANTAIHNAISGHKLVSASYSNFDIIRKIRPHLAPFIPQDKPSRIVEIGDYLPLPCGGTHVRSLDELGLLRVTKAKRAKENIRVSYEVIGPLSSELGSKEHHL
jgi:Ser-tRNA(Ala) deacylase AlaX